MPVLVDTTIRLLGQEPLAGAMPTADLLQLAEILDGAGFAYLEVSGGGVFDTTSVKTIALWQDTIAAYGLAWASALAVGAVTLLLSVIFRSTAAAMGTMMATLVGGKLMTTALADALHPHAASAIADFSFVQITDTHVGAHSPAKLAPIARPSWRP